jgi:hypothetical protein
VSSGLYGLACAAVIGAALVFRLPSRLVERGAR